MRPPRSRPTAIRWAALALSLVACDSTRRLPPDPVDRCHQCHGGVFGHAAPPRSSGGRAPATTVDAVANGNTLSLRLTSHTWDPVTRTCASAASHVAQT